MLYINTTQSFCAFKPLLNSRPSRQLPNLNHTENFKTIRGQHSTIRYLGHDEPAQQSSQENRLPTLNLKI